MGCRKNQFTGKTVFVRTGRLAQWLQRPTVKRFTSRRVSSSPTLFHSSGLKQATNSASVGTVFQSTRAGMNTGPCVWGRLANCGKAKGHFLQWKVMKVQRRFLLARRTSRLRGGGVQIKIFQNNTASSTQNAYRKNEPLSQYRKQF